MGGDAAPAADPAERRDEPATLAAAVLDEEARRQAAQAASAPVLPDDLLPGVADEPLTLRQAVATGGVFTLVMMTLLNLIDELPRAIRVVAPDIQDTLGISDTTLLGVLSFGGVAFTLGAVPMARLADRVKRVSIIPVASWAWATTVALTSLVANAFQLFWANLATGFGQSYRIPVTNSILTDTYPIQARSRVFAVEGMGRPLGQLIGPLVVGGVAAAVGGTEGWRWALVVIAIPPALVGLASLRLREPERGRFEQLAILGGELTRYGRELPVSVGAAYERLKKVNTFYYLCIGVGVLGFSLVAVPVQFNLLLDDAYGYGPLKRGIVESLMWLAAFVTIPVAGRVFDATFRRDPTSTLRIMGWLVVASGPITFVALRFTPAVPLIVGLALAQGLTSAAFVGAPSTIAAVAPYRLRSQAFALLPVFIFLMGGFFGGLLVGAISDARGERTAMSIVAPPAAIVGGALIVYGSRFIRRDISLAVEELLEEQEEHNRLAESAADAPVIQIRNLDFSYGKVQVLFDVAFEVARGEVLALLGTNGAGKSTVLRAISGLGIPDRGVIRLNGQTITYTEAELRVELGIVQVAGGKAIFDDLTVEENMRVGAFTRRDGPAIVAERIEWALGLFPPLEVARREPAGNLSGGQQQMLAVAKAMLLDPEVLIIDELSLGLAPVVVRDLLEVVERLREEGVTMIVVEQSLNVALALADRALFMEKGQVRFDGPTAELARRDDLVRAVFLGDEGG